MDAGTGWFSGSTTELVMGIKSDPKGFSSFFLKYSVSFLGFCTCPAVSSRPVGVDNHDRHVPMSSHIPCNPQPPYLMVDLRMVFLNSFLATNKTCHEA